MVYFVFPEPVPTPDCRCPLLVFFWGSSLRELASKALHLLSYCLLYGVTFWLPWMTISPFAINLLLFLFLSSQNMTVAKMSVYKQMKLACCFDCGRSERDCSCMSGSVHSNMDTLQRAYPLSSVSVHDCATTLRACKLYRPTRVVTCLLCVPCMCVCFKCRYTCVYCMCFIRKVVHVAYLNVFIVIIISSSIIHLSNIYSYYFCGLYWVVVVVLLCGAALLQLLALWLAHATSVKHSCGDCY